MQIAHLVKQGEGHFVPLCFLQKNGCLDAAAVRVCWCFCVHDTVVLFLQELDIQNAAAAEQHVNDMAEHEAKIAEAAAAWEAERKKKKGKAKDEVSPMHMLVSSVPQSASLPDLLEA